MLAPISRPRVLTDPTKKQKETLLECQALEVLQGLWIDEFFPAVTPLFGYLERIEHLEDQEDKNNEDFVIVKISSFLKDDPTEPVTLAVKICKVFLSKCS